MINLISAPVERRSRPVTFFALAAFMLVTALPAFAGTINVFGPKVFVRSEGKPNVSKNTFKLPAGITQCQFTITGAEDGPLTANNVSIQLNGVEILDSKELRGNNQQRPATLQEENSLIVTLKGKPGDAVTVTISGEVQVTLPVPPSPPTPPMPTPPMPTPL